MPFHRSFERFISIVALNFFAIPAIFALPSPIPQFAHCLEQRACATHADSMSCCKSCLSTVKFTKRHASLQKIMTEHLDLVCHQFEKPAGPEGVNNAVPYSKFFLTGTYVHTSGKDGCNRDRIMWTAPVDVYSSGDNLIGATYKQNGTIRVYPLARCEDGQIGEVLSNDQLHVKLHGHKTVDGAAMQLSFSIAPAATSSSSHTQYFVDLISELASLSFNHKNQTLNSWTINNNTLTNSLVEKFKTNDEATERGWKGNSEVFVQAYHG